ncbi:hypothetical protein AAVH_24589 [Aphelenchoides avenae]|nr:hypothetical protein AAVH_24589 [Aphelenchus avenae]
MSSVPSEVLEDVLQPLDRWTLDGVQFTNRRFLRLIAERMTDVCLRQLNYAYAVFNTSNEMPRLTFTSAIAKLVIEAPITAHQLSFLSGSCTELTSTELRDVVLHVSPTSLCLYSCHLRACQLTDEFLCSLRKNNVRRALFQNVVPVDGESFCVTDDAVVGFRMQQDVCVGEEEDAPKQGPLGELVLHNGSFTKDLFKRLVEANTSSTRTQPLRIFVSPCSVVEEDLRDFAQHLSYRHRGMPYETRIYDFTDEQQNAPKHLQIVLHAENNELEMICAQRPDPLFYKSDE